MNPATTEFPNASATTGQSARGMSITRARIVGILIGLGAATVSFRPTIVPFIGVSSLLILAALTVAIVALPPNYIRHLRVTAIDIAFVSYIAVRIVIEFLNSTEFTVPYEFGTVSDLIVGYLALFSCRVAASSVDNFFAVLVGVALPGVGVAAIGFAQIVGPIEISNLLVHYFYSGGLDTRIEGGWEIRGTSTIGHWTALGGYLTLVAAILAAKIVASHRQGTRCRWLWVAIAIVILGQLSTLTFATIAATAMVLAVALLRVGIRPAHILVLSFGILVIWIILGGMISSRFEKQMYETSNDAPRYPFLPESVAYRVDIWVTESIPAIMERPIAGWGIGTYKYVGTEAASEYLRWLSPESEWIRTALSAGIPALVLQVTVVFLSIVWLKRLRRVVEETFVDPLLVGVIGIVIVSFIHSHLANRGVPLVLWPVVGAGLGLLLSRSTMESRNINRKEL